MTTAPVTFVNINSANVSSLTWPLGSAPMFYQDNESLLGAGFKTTNTTQQVLFSVTTNSFFGRSDPGLSYTQAWQSTFSSITGTYSFVKLPSVTQLGDLELYNGRTQLFVSTGSPSNAFQTKEALGQLIVNLLNGPSYNPGAPFQSYTCPCQNGDSGIAHCAQGAWQAVAQNIVLTLSDKVDTLMAPCMNPGNTMFVSEGIGTLFNTTAQVKRVRNLDRVRFRTVNATPKPCANSVLFQFAAVTCGQNERDECPSKATPTSSCAAPIQTRLGLDFSLQATILGTNVLDSTRLCDNLVNVQKGVSCPLEAEQCLEVFLPLMLVNTTFEVPVFRPSDPIVKAAADTFCNILNPNQSLSAYFGRFQDASFSMGLAMSEKPLIQYPTVTVIPDEYKTFVETAIMDLGNTVLRNNLSEQLTTAFSPFFQKSFALEPLLNDIPICLNFSATQFEMSCPPQGFVVPPATCNPCDFCCICYTGGDCGDKCLQRCPCVKNFCTAVDRIIYPLWWKLVVGFLLLLLIAIVVIGGFMRGV